MRKSRFLKLLTFRSKSSDADLVSKRLQLNKGGGATSFLLRDLDCGDVISIPIARSVNHDDSTAKNQLGMGNLSERHGSDRGSLSQGNFLAQLHLQQFDFE